MVVEELPLLCVRRAPHSPPLEHVECKGLGHPDTICDQLSESLARRLASQYMDRTGGIRHFNVDKGLLIAGRAEVGFGGGRIIDPIRVIMAGRVDLASVQLDLDELRDAVAAEMARLVPNAPDGASRIDLELHPPSGDLAFFGVVKPGAEPLANDTSLAVVSLPRSGLEDLVHSTQKLLVSPQLREDLPIGTDVKIMGTRLREQTHLTVAAATLAGHVSDMATYRDLITQVHDRVLDHAHELLGDQPVDVIVNNGAEPYITVSGTSAEAGDDGEVGRGNRFGGLITPFRQMSMEACAGKNPVAHVGKTYHCMAYDIASRLLETAGEVTVGLLSRIGEPVSRPQFVHVETVEEIDPLWVSQVVEESLADWQGVRDRLLAAQYELF